jgi:hypothetical protein
MSGRTLLFIIIGACGWMLLGSGIAAAQQAVLERDAQLRVAPQTGAAVVAELKAGTSAEVITQKGPWVNLRTPSGTGWTNSYNVRFLSAGAQPAPKSAPSSAARRSITPTIGIRGLDEEDLKNARFDDAQMNLLDQYAASRQDAENAARASGLTRSRVDYFQ